MPTQVTNFQCPPLETEFEEVKPLVVSAEKWPIVVDPNDPPLEPMAVYCCECVAGITICIPEQQDGEYLTSVVAQTFAFWWA